MIGLRSGVFGLRPAIVLTLALAAARLTAVSPTPEPPVLAIPELDAVEAPEVPYRMHHSDEDPHCARIRAIAFARTAGILGARLPYQIDPEDVAALVKAGCPLSIQDVETLLPLPPRGWPPVDLSVLTSEIAWTGCSDSY